MRNNTPIVCAVSEVTIKDPAEVIVITKVPEDIDGAPALLNKKVSREAYMQLLRPAGFRGFNLATAKSRRETRRTEEAKVTIGKLLAAKGQTLVT
ncbi:MAG TPA: hypothetical protein VLA04_05015 [Verrucomicrobiae bacterium]|nr:hypothetical protein [Verrucomicrobiae bacterium]